MYVPKVRLDRLWAHDEHEATARREEGGEYGVWTVS